MCLPTLQAFPGAHIIHQVQDGRDHALRNLRMPRDGGSSSSSSMQSLVDSERFFVQLFSGESGL